MLCSLKFDSVLKMEKLTKAQQESVKKLSTDALRLKLLRSGLDEETVCELAREELMVRWVEIDAAGKGKPGIVVPEVSKTVGYDVELERERLAFEKLRYEEEKVWKEQELAEERVRKEQEFALRKMELEQQAELKAKEILRYEEEKAQKEKELAEERVLKEQELALRRMELEQQAEWKTKELLQEAE